MNCYDCNLSGDTTPAIAVCHDCGAGVCPDHAISGQHTLTAVRATNWQTPVDPHSAGSGARSVPPPSTQPTSYRRPGETTTRSAPPSTPIPSLL